MHFFDAIPLLPTSESRFENAQSMATFSTAPPSNPPPPSPSSSISTVHPDILSSHILTRLDGLALPSVACTSAELNSLSSRLWTNICLSTWPSIKTPRLREVVSRFPSGHRSFFSHSFPLLVSCGGSTASPPPNRDPPPELISAVDIFYRECLIFSRVVVTETESSWFRFAPFRIDMLEPKDKCDTPIPKAEPTAMCQELLQDLRLSWILVDPVRPRAMNVSGQEPVSVDQHWLSGEVHARFAVVLGGRRGSSSELVMCRILVTFGCGVQRRKIHVKAVTLQVEDLDGALLNGKVSLGILHRAFEGKKGISERRECEGNRRYEEFWEMRRQRKERKLMFEETLDMLCVGFGVVILPQLGYMFRADSTKVFPYSGGVQNYTHIGLKMGEKWLCSTLSDTHNKLYW